MLKTIFAQEDKADAESQWEVVADALPERQAFGLLLMSERPGIVFGSGLRPEMPLPLSFGAPVRSRVRARTMRLQPHVGQGRGSTRARRSALPFRLDENRPPGQKSCRPSRC